MHCYFITTHNEEDIVIFYFPSLHSLYKQFPFSISYNLYFAYFSLPYKSNFPIYFPFFAFPLEAIPYLANPFQQCIAALPYNDS